MPGTPNLASSTLPRLLLCATCTLIGCGTEPDELGRCSPPLQVTVHTAPAYVFEWAPSGCEVYSLAIDYEGSVQWYVYTIDDRNGLSSPLRYGVTPSGAEGSDAEPLLSGRRYRVELVRIRGGQAEIVLQQYFNTP